MGRGCRLLWLVRQACTASLAVNGQTRQDDTTDKMLYNCDYQLAFLHRHFGLKAGDLVFTGTPKGVGRLERGDRLTVGLDNERFEILVK